MLNAIDKPEHRGSTVPMTNLGVTLMQLFVSHEIARTPTLEGRENAFDLDISPDDPITVGRDGRFVMPMQRAAHIDGTGVGDPRQQRSDVTAAFDGSIVYGSTPERTAQLRANDGTGRVKVTPRGTPPVIAGVPTVGDVRGSENPLLLQAHTLFLRQHNKLADGLEAQCDALGESCSGDLIFDGARRLLTAQTQKIVYEELLPAFLGPDELETFLPDPNQIATIRGAINEATTAVLRVGHSQVPDTVLAIDAAGNRTEIPLADCFFTNCLAGVPLDDFLRGAAHQSGEPVDTVFAKALRNSQLPAGDATFVIGLPETTTHRAADHRLGGYLALRAVLGFPDASLEELLPPHVLDA